MKTSGKYTAFVMLLFTIGVGFVSCLASASDKGSAPMVLRAEKNTYVSQMPARTIPALPKYLTSTEATQECCQWQYPNCTPGTI